MIHIYLRDDIHASDIRKYNKKQAFLISINAHADVLGENPLFRELHMQIRFNEFKSFNKSLKDVVDKVEDVYLKYGGLCFLWGNNKERYDEVLGNISTVMKYKYDIDNLNNGSLLERSDYRAATDKLILEKVFKYKDPILIYYRPTNEFKTKSKEEVIKILDTMSNEDIKNNTKYFYKLNF